ncbi:MAG: ABC transporter ATP-binding protein [Burkholderiaceae bacterium]|nr:ABC transporter ATP-binding protein [Burkholderiaceae bacterium]
MQKSNSSDPWSLWAMLLQLLEKMSKRRRLQLVGLSVLMLLGAVAELATLGAVIPFLSLLTDPALASNYPLLNKLFFMLGWDKETSILLPATVFFACTAICAAGLRTFLSWIGFKFTFGLGADISVEVYRRTLYQPLCFHVARNTSEILAGLVKVQSVVFGVINPLIQGVVSLALSLAIIGALIYIDVVTAFVAAVGFSLIYVAVSFSTRRRLSTNSKIIADGETQRVQAAQEGLGSIRDIIIDGTQDIYINRFQKIDAAHRQAQTVNSFISTAPRYIIEGIGIVLLVSLAYLLSFRTGGVSAAIPVLGALAIGAQKLMPQMQQIYYSLATFSGSRAILADVIRLLEQPISPEYLQLAPSSVEHLQVGISLKNVSFSYQGDAPEVIKHLTLEIPRGSRVGFIGKTGSGKSTVLDLIMGLLAPTSGGIEIDGQPITGANRRAWQARIAHVAQAIYLADASIAENIAFGIDVQHIDQERVREAAQKAQLAEFIETLPAQYQTGVGERGVRLSGGQRQRIGLARALYKRADVLVLDEATSALDDATEKAVMKAIDSLGDHITVLIIAHRVSTLSNCDRIFELRNGSLLREGSYQDLIQPQLTAQAVIPNFTAR